MASTNEPDPGYGPGPKQTVVLSYDFLTRLPDGSTTTVPGSLTVQVDIPEVCGLSC